MAMKDYSDEFKADAVPCTSPRPGRRAADLGINRATLREWMLRVRERRGIAPVDARRGGRRRPGQGIRPRPLIRTSGSGNLRPGWQNWRRVSGGWHLCGTRHRWRPPAQKAPHYRPGPDRNDGRGPVPAGLHRPGTGTQVHGRHHLSAIGRRGIPLPGHRAGLLQPQGRGLVHRRPHAHRPGRRRATDGRRDPRRPDRAIFHSDHGAQYGSRAFADLCSDLGVTRSTDTVGSSADNAACESFHASLKRETLQGARDFGDPATCRRTVFVWLTRYNTRRRHSANGHLSPNDYERRHHTAKLSSPRDT